jgi:hypothetical protein
MCGCSTASTFIGDKKLAAEVKAAVLSGGKLVVVQTGDTAALDLSGRLQAGARARNLEQTLSLAAQLVDWRSGQKLVGDAKIVTLRQASDGWGETDPSNPAAFIALPTCVGEPVILSITVNDGESPSRAATTLVTINPSCTGCASCDVDGGGRD